MEYNFVNEYFFSLPPRMYIFSLYSFLRILETLFHTLQPYSLFRFYNLSLCPWWLMLVLAHLST